MSQTHWRTHRWHLQWNSVRKRGVISLTCKTSSCIMPALGSKRNRALFGVATCVFKTMTPLTIFKTTSIVTDDGFGFLYFCTSDTHISYLKMGVGLSVWVPHCCCWMCRESRHIPGNMLRVDANTFPDSEVDKPLRSGWDRLKQEGPTQEGTGPPAKNRELSGGLQERPEPCAASTQSWPARKHVLASFLYFYPSNGSIILPYSTSGSINWAYVRKALSTVPDTDHSPPRDTHLLIPYVSLHKKGGLLWIIQTSLTGPLGSLNEEEGSRRVKVRVMYSEKASLGHGWLWNWKGTMS